MRKKCSKCGVEKELCEFHKTKRTKDGVRGICKICRKIESKDYYINNYERLKEKSKDYRDKNPDKVKEGLKNYRIKNLDKVREKNRKWSKSENGKKSKKKYY